MSDFHTPRGAGGTPGGIGEFALGVALAAAGLWLLMSRVTVTSGPFFGGWFGNGLGEEGALALALVPFVVGVAGLFQRASAKWAWACVGLALGMMALNVVLSLHLIFLPTSLPTFLGMVTLVAVGLGLIVRALRDHS